MDNSLCYVPVSIGELFDKYTILQIKQNRIKDNNKLLLVNKELDHLTLLALKYNVDLELISELRKINETLWDIEDRIREKEYNNLFDSEFIELARSVYITNDRRSEMKNKINNIFNSELYDVKSYSKYTNDYNVSKTNVDEQVQLTSPIKHRKDESKDESDTIKKYCDLLQKEPLNVNYLRKLGELYEMQSQYYDAVECYVKIIKTCNNNDLQTICILKNQIGVCYSNLLQYKLAIHYFKQVLEVVEIIDVCNNIGVCYIHLKNYKEAEIYLLKAHNIDNKNEITNKSLGDLYYYTKKYTKSIKQYKKIKKPSDRIIFSLSFPYLAKKDFVNGFTLYEHRLKYNDIDRQTGEITRLEVPQEYWSGQKNVKLLILGEQGLGDNIQYYRFIIELSLKYPKLKITYFCKKEISGIFKTYNNIEVIQNVPYVYYYDFKIYIMSLPKILNITKITHNTINYIKSNDDKCVFWKSKMDEINKLKIGFVYRGLLNSYIEKHISLDHYKELCDLNVQLICLHKKNEIANDIQNVSFGNKIIYYDIDIDNPFEDTICLLQNIDLLITVDTYIVHLAGILGVKTWLLLGVSDWRWFDDNKNTYWYESVELIRTNENEELKDLLVTVKNKLNENYKL